MAQLHSAFIVSYLDYDLETTTVSVYGPPVLADGTNYTIIQGYWDDLEAAIDAMVLGTKIKVTRIARTEAFARTRPASKAAQRETKLFIAGHGTTNLQPADVSIGTFDTDNLVTIPAGQNLPSYVDLTAGVGLALKQALDAYWTVKPAFTEFVVTDSAVHVGRNT